MPLAPSEMGIGKNESKEKEERDGGRGEQRLK